MKVQRVRFTEDYRREGVVAYRAGECYPTTPTTVSAVAHHRSAELVDVDLNASAHGAEQAAADAAWNQTNRATIAADSTLRSEANPAAARTSQMLADLQVRTRRNSGAP